MDELFVILKTAERCNLACSYCYFFFGGDESYKTHSPIISQKTIHDISIFLQKGVDELKIKKVNLYFHGGEPLLQKKKHFDEMCNIFKKNISCELLLGVQTNGVLVDEEWLTLFKKHKVGVGVSIDGPKEINDIYRVDHKGRGSYDRIKNGLDLLKKNLNDRVAVLCVMNSKTSGKDSYYHLVYELGLTHMDFLFPDNHYENSNFETNEAIGTYICDVFDAWVHDNNDKIHIRFFSSLISRLLGRSSYYINFGPFQEKVGAISISSDGHLGPDDTLKATSFDLAQADKTIYDLSLRDFLKEPIFGYLRRAKTNLPSLCKGCIWSKICCGGEPVNRYKNETIFDNPSVYCSSLKRIYEKVSSHLLKNGLDVTKLADVLGY
jgi:uncharacterized protein